MGDRRRRLQEDEDRLRRQQGHRLLHERPDRRGAGLSIRFEGVEKRFGTGDRAVRALAPIHLDVPDRSVVAFVGPSGCGKTTLLRILAGLTPPSAGSLSVNGAEVWQDERPDRDAVRDMAMVFQDACLLPWLTVEANVALPLRVQGVARAERLERAREMCAITGIAGFERHLPAALSGGMQHRAAIARALVGSPRTLLLDEPFASLDAITRDAMNMELQRVWEHRPCTSLLVTHAIPEAVLLADQVVVFSGRPGEVVGTLDVAFERPRPIELMYSAAFQDLVRSVHEQLAAVS